MGWREWQVDRCIPEEEVCRGLFFNSAPDTVVLKSKKLMREIDSFARSIIEQTCLILTN